ncbi:peptidylprolyl isomerase [Methyloprofundus sedimenti]|uniref:Peptidyl-prolyl cis-trans isomerase n=1 Tax=Methyloprofundus sedimenti TaxID=1420851 RepID=A0A1V8M8K2_9GAMM|nr:FKBP-type peptidyl-prolyl cis-trans isomerase [Methyloprofundus sedimenti]OQK17723.1 peptidylprolyl isomerase [Methyloprofundus sedimenti]
MGKTQLVILVVSIILFIGYFMFTKPDPELADNNKQTGEAFLAENAGKEGVITTASGLQYMILKAGEGNKPTASSNVTVHYQGTTLDGKEFDSSYSRNAPATFPLNRVIAGWTEGVQLMPIGAKYRFFIHPDLGYGAKGAGAAIGPNETLIFDVELLSIQ